MKRLLLVSTFLILSTGLFAQVKVGLIFSPGIAYNRLQLKEETPNFEIETKGVGLKFLAGPELSFYFGDNYAFTTGVMYAARRAGVNVKYINSIGQISQADSIFNLQYIQLPATFKLFTNEISTDLKLYFQLGAALDIKVGEKLKDSKIKTARKFRPYDASLIAGTGVELQMGENTYFLVGLRYNRGLINILKDSQFNNKAILKNDMISLDLGIRF